MRKHSTLISSSFSTGQINPLVILLYLLNLYLVLAVKSRFRIRTIRLINWTKKPSKVMVEKFQRLLKNWSHLEGQEKRQNILSSLWIREISQNGVKSVQLPKIAIVIFLDLLIHLLAPKENFTIKSSVKLKRTTFNGNSSKMKMIRVIVWGNKFTKKMKKWSVNDSNYTNKMKRKSVRGNNYTKKMKSITVSSNK